MTRRRIKGWSYDVEGNPAPLPPWCYQPQRGALRWGWVATMFAGLALGVLLGQLVLRWGT